MHTPASVTFAAYYVNGSKVTPGAFMDGVPYNILDEAIQARDLVQLSDLTTDFHFAAARSCAKPSQSSHKTAAIISSFILASRTLALSLSSTPCILAGRIQLAIRLSTTNTASAIITGRIWRDVSAAARSSGHSFGSMRRRGPPSTRPSGGARVCSLDPGVRTFLTWSHFFFSLSFNSPLSPTFRHSPTHGAGHVGNQDAQKLICLCFSLDDLLSRTAKAPSRRRVHMRRAQARLRQRIRNLVHECHRKTALWLASTLDVIITPPFNSSQMPSEDKLRDSEKDDDMEPWKVPGKTHIKSRGAREASRGRRGSIHNQDLQPVWVGGSEAGRKEDVQV